MQEPLLPSLQMVALMVGLHLLVAQLVGLRLLRMNRMVALLLGLHLLVALPVGLRPSEGKNLKALVGLHRHLLDMGGGGIPPPT